MLHCVSAVKHKLQCKVGYFDLYGFDFMIDEDMKVLLTYALFKNLFIYRVYKTVVFEFHVCTFESFFSNCEMLVFKSLNAILLQIWLIEINVNPCLATNCEALREAVPEVVRESIRAY